MKTGSGSARSRAAEQRGESFTEVVVGFAERSGRNDPRRQVAAAAQRYLTEDRYVRVVLLPQL